MSQAPSPTTATRSSSSKKTTPPTPFVLKPGSTEKEAFLQVFDVIAADLVADLVSYNLPLDGTKWTEKVTTPLRHSSCSIHRYLYAIHLDAAL